MLNVDVGFRRYNSREEFCVVPRKYEMKCLWSLCILDQLLNKEAIGAENWNGFRKKNVNFWDNLQNQFRWNIGSGGRIFWSSVCHSGFALSWVLVQVAPPPLYIPQLFIYLTRLVHLGVFCTSIFIQCIFPQLFIHLTICQLENSFYMACPELFAWMQPKLKKLHLILSWHQLIAILWQLSGIKTRGLLKRMAEMLLVTKMELGKNMGVGARPCLAEVLREKGGLWKEKGGRKEWTL